MRICRSSVRASLIFDTDEHLRETALEKLAGLPAPFRDGGSVTAGNASGINDGAAAILVASETAVKQHGLTPMAKIIDGDRRRKACLLWAIARYR